MTVHEWDPSCFRDLTSIPCWYEWYLTLTSSTGPIFHVSSNPSLSEQNHHSQVTCIIGMLQHLQLHPPGDILIKPAVSPAMINRMSSGSVSNLPLWLRNKFTCAGTLIASGFVKSDKTSGETLQSNCSFDCRYGFLRAEKRMILDLLSQFFTPIRDRSEDTELVDGSDCAKWQLRGRYITVVVNRQHSSFLAFRPRSNALVARKTGCPLDRRWSIIISADWFHKPFGLLGSWSEEYQCPFWESVCVSLSFYRILNTCV